VTITTAPRFQIKVRPSGWDESEHPRDRQGRFIETGAEVRIWGGGSGKVVGNLGNGRIEVERATDGKRIIVHRNYLTVTARPNGEEPTAEEAPDVEAAPVVEADPNAEEVPELADGEDEVLPDRGGAPDRLVQGVTPGEQVGDYTVGEYVDGPSAVDGWVVGVTPTGGPIVRTEDGKDWPLLPDAQIARDVEDAPEMPGDLIADEQAAVAPEQAPAAPEATPEPVAPEQPAAAPEQAPAPDAPEDMRPEPQRAAEQAMQPADETTENVAARLHDQWRAARRQPDGTYEPRMKDDGAGGQVDIANTDYADLPEQWQRENRESARSAIEAARANGGANADVEAVAEAVHVAWLERNGEWAEEVQKRPYADLPEDEKEKDRVVAREAITALGGEPEQQAPAAAPEQPAEEPQAPGGTVEPIDSLNPSSSGVFEDYESGREYRATAPLADNMTTLAETEGVDPDDTVTVYRGVPDDAPEGLQPGDFVTTNEQLARDYMGGQGRIETAEVRYGDVLDDRDEPGGGEYIYRPQQAAEEPAGERDLTALSDEELGAAADAATALDEMRAIREEYTRRREALTATPETPAETPAEPTGEFNPDDLSDEELLAEGVRAIGAHFDAPDDEEAEGHYNEVLNAIDDRGLPMPERPAREFPDATGDPLPLNDRSLANDGVGVDPEQWFRLDWNSDTDDPGGDYPMNPARGQAFRIRGNGVQGPGDMAVADGDRRINFTAEDGSVGDFVLPGDVRIVPVERPANARRSEAEVAERQNARRARGEEVDPQADSTTEPYDEPEAAAAATEAPEATTPQVGDRVRVTDNHQYAGEVGIVEQVGPQRTNVRTDNGVRSIRNDSMEVVEAGAEEVAPPEVTRARRPRAGRRAASTATAATGSDAPSAAPTAPSTWTPASATPADGTPSPAPTTSPTSRPPTAGVCGPPSMRARSPSASRRCATPGCAPRNSPTARRRAARRPTPTTPPRRLPASRPSPSRWTTSATRSRCRSRLRATTTSAPTWSPPGAT